MSESQPWHLVLPVKHALRGKTRLIAPAAVDHPALARAIALDSIAAAAAAVGPSQVTVVTSDPVVAVSCPPGAVIVTDPATDLDGAITAGVAAARKRGAGPVAVLLADVPAARPSDLREVLAAASEHPRSYVADAEGTGTVLLAVREGALSACFGPDSAARHGRSAVALDAPATLRRDIDDAEELAAALTLGVGECTLAVLTEPRGSGQRNEPRAG